jgi:hypothetical protein
MPTVGLAKLLDSTTTDLLSSVDGRYLADILACMAKVLISLPDDLLAEIDREASRAGTTRSGYLQAAARSMLPVPTHARIADALERGRRALTSAGAFESTALIRRERDERDAADRRL